MKTAFLFPYPLKKVGWALFIPTVLLSIAWLSYDTDNHPLLPTNVFAVISNANFFEGSAFFKIIKNDISDEIIGIMLIISSAFIVLSKEQDEDEFIEKIRLDSLLWAIYVNYACLIISILFVYDLPFFWVMVFNMFTVLIFFIVRFNWAKGVLKKSMQDEK